MTVSRLPHGLFATPNIGAGRLVDFFNSDNIFFVDGDNGSVSNEGKSPDSPVALSSTAIGFATRGGVIYVRPKNTAASAQSYYQEDIVIPITKPNLSLIGCVPDGCTGAQSGPQIKPSTVTGHLIDVKGANFYIEKLRLTLTGGTADQNKCIIHAVNDVAATQKPSGLVVRDCRFENDKSKPSYSGTEAVACIGLGSVRDVIIEGNTFYNVIGGIAYQATSGVGHMIQISGNIFSSPPAVSDCFILMSTSSEAGIMIVGNYFLDGLPALSTGGYKRFVQIIGAATGLFADNWFATTTDSFTSAGSECVIPNTMFGGNWFNNGTANGA